MFHIPERLNLNLTSGCFTRLRLFTFTCNLLRQPCIICKPVASGQHEPKTFVDCRYLKTEAQIFNHKNKITSIHLTVPINAFI